MKDLVDACSPAGVHARALKCAAAVWRAVAPAAAAGAAAAAAGAAWVAPVAEYVPRAPAAVAPAAVALAVETLLPDLGRRGTARNAAPLVAALLQALGDAVNDGASAGDARGGTAGGPEGAGRSDAGHGAAESTDAGALFSHVLDCIGDRGGPGVLPRAVWGAALAAPGARRGVIAFAMADKRRLHHVLIPSPDGTLANDDVRELAARALALCAADGDADGAAGEAEAMRHGGAADGNGPRRGKQGMAAADSMLVTRGALDILQLRWPLAMACVCPLPTWVCRPS
jgi:hypothetical protein